LIYKTKSDGNIYKELRRKTGLSQEEAASMLSVASTAISKWERGLSLPDQNNLPKIAALYGTTVDYLLTGKDAPQRTTEPSPARETLVQDLFDDLSDHGKGLILSAFKGIYLIEKGAVLNLPANLHKLEK